ncbi:MAG: hypothetical protein NTX38_01850 [Methylobacter sp.]|nr:hypothetical protein [Methylobacter sp.]
MFIYANRACANGRWAQNNPRRVEVNERLGNQKISLLIKKEEKVKSPAQARQIHNQQRQLRQEEL